MKAVVKNHEKKELKYPCLMIGIEDGEVVLFREYRMGTVVNEALCRIGFYSGAWSMDQFEPFNGTIELSND